MPQGYRKDGTKLGFQKGHIAYIPEQTDELREKKSHKGEKNPRWRGGKKRCIDCNKLTSYYAGGHGERCSKCFHIKFSGENCPLYGVHKLGKDHHNWQGGLTEMNIRLRGSFEFKQWRNNVFHRDNFTCQECSSKKGSSFNAHHKKRFSIIFKEFLQEYNQFSPIEDKETLIRLAITYKPFWDIDNGITLCEDCHKLTDNYAGKKAIYGQIRFTG